MEEKYYGVYDGKELKAVGTKEQCDKYSIDRKLLSTRLVEVEPDWGNEVFVREYLLSDEMYDCPMTEAEHDVLAKLEYDKIITRQTVMSNIKRILEEPRLNKVWKEKYEEIYSQVEILYNIEMQNFKEDFEDIICNYDLNKLAQKYDTIK